MGDERRHSLLSSFAEHRDALLRFLQRRLDNAALAEDLTQETWLRAANAQGTAAIDNPRSFLFRIAANLARDHQRHVRQRIELETAAEVAEAIPDRQPSPETVILHRSELAQLRRVVDGLSPRCREVFILGKFEGLSLAEIAARLGISRNTVVSHMVTALASIEREMSSDK
jgi:RNA polymerase sigma factor (sigma-70 family)